ncbi:MAG TPA: glycoside hydrolase family 3 C-terminal domain-containing protein [Jatrophihabitans sp.]|nr:glycoside hydrolase family 3 C-terminal domain-containing protein [Jatrophihabitans sp.]
MLTKMLREEWGFAGLVMSDWGAVNDRVAALAAGLDLEMPSSGGVNDARLVDAVQRGELPEQLLDQAASRVLQLLDRVEPDVLDGAGFDAAAHHRLAREAAAECAVLLKNDGDLLPLDATGAAPIAVLGELARSPRYQGAGSSQVNPTELLSALAEIRALTERPVTFAPGYLVDRAGDAGEERELRAAAVTAAARAEVVLLFLGLPPSFESEGWDRTSIDLPPEQVRLLTEVAEANANLVVVLSNGGVVSVAPWQHLVPALLEGWLLGQAGGGAIADLLFGHASPSGRLAETIPLRLEDNPSFGNFPGELGEVRYGEGLLVGYRHYDTRLMPVAYPFGHGLSYTSFAYSDLSAAADGTDVLVQVTVRNTGSRPGAEVVQVYRHEAAGAVLHPTRELVAFEKVLLQPGEMRTVELRVRRRELAYYHVRRGGWVVESREVLFEVGSSSRDIRLSVPVAVQGDAGAEPLRADSSLEEWLVHPAGGPLLRQQLARTGAGLLGQTEDVLHLLGNFPLSRLAMMPDTGLDAAAVAELLDRLG